MTVKRVLLGLGALVAALAAYVVAIASLWYRDGAVEDS
jgi:hypothetical protein